MAIDFGGPYTDPSATTQSTDPNAGKAIPTPAPARVGPGATGRSPVYDDASRAVPPPEGTADYAVINAGAPARPVSPNSPVVGRDPYANNGMVGQDFFKS